MSVLRRRGLLKEESGGGGDISDYVQDGIIFWLDGIENTRSGHNAAATKWESLVSSSHDVTYNSAKVISDKYCIPNGQSTMEKVVNGITTTSTIEVVLEYVAAGTYQMIIPWRGNNYGTTWILKAQNMIAFSASNNNQSKGILLQSGINTYAACGKSLMYLNGQQTSIVSNSETWGSTLTRQLFYYTAQYPASCVSKIYAIRVYNRALTAAEILKNAQLDAARFK